MEQDKIKAAFDAAKGNEQLTSVLTSLFGKQETRPVTERIKTFSNAVDELGKDHPLVRNWQNFNDEEAKDVEAYLKLRIIVAALNEGWQPMFEDGERRWAPYFVFYTNDILANMEDEEKDKIYRVVYRSSNYANANGGVSCAYADIDASDTLASVGSRLAFRTEELAEYAGKQFIDIYCQMMGFK